MAEEVVAPDEPADEPTADEVAEEAPAEEPAAEEAPAEEPAAEEAPAEEPAEPRRPLRRRPAVEEAPAAEEEAPAAEEEAPPAEEEPAAEEAPAAAAAPAAAPAEEEAPEELGPKERRRRARSAHTGEARPARSPEERAQERAERRSTKARQRRAYRQKQRQRRGGESRDQTPQPAVETEAKAAAKVRQGIVVSDKADKTITVRIDTARAHRMYKKIVRSSSVLHAHDERNEAHTGDTVRVVESRPLSRTKRWRLVEVLERARSRLPGTKRMAASSVTPIVAVGAPCRAAETGGR